MKLLRFITTTIANFINYGVNGLRQMKWRDEKIERMQKTINAQSTLLATSGKKW